MRGTTVRPERIAAGTLKPVGADEDLIYDNFNLLPEDDQAYNAMTHASNPYGDGHACAHVADVPEKEL